jgi:hypothetical protein
MGQMSCPRLAARLAVPALITLGAATAAAGPAPGPGDEDLCRVVDVDFTPSEELQIVVWLEDTAGNYVDTIYITDATGRRGLGNRPGRFDFNSGWAWPYGRRINTFPVWAHRHGMAWPQIVFQDGNDDGLSHSFSESSVEAYYCRPLRETEPGWDAQTCASVAYTDKGILDPAETSLYPPREDHAYDEGVDHPDVLEYDDLNPFDAVSAATPVGGTHVELGWPLPESLPLGDYVLFVEVSKEFDHNATYNPTTYPEPTGILYADYGVAYRGQPSVVYRVPITIGNDLDVARVADYEGYGDPDGFDGELRAPDGTIDDDVPGSGAQRLMTTIDDAGGGTYRVRVQARAERDDAGPAAPGAGEVVEFRTDPDDPTAFVGVLSFVEPGDDGLDGRVEGYEVRYRAGETITEDDFLSANPVAQVIVPDEGGVTRQLEVPSLNAETDYYVAIRAFDDCKNYGPITVMAFTTPDPPIPPEVDACFVATAAYGSLMAADVEMLRHARDGLLRGNVVGELAVEAYYTFGPALAGLIAPSEDLRGVARGVLGPVVDWVRELSFVELSRQD